MTTRPEETSSNINNEVRNVGAIEENGGPDIEVGGVSVNVDTEEEKQEDYDAAGKNDNNDDEIYNSPSTDDVPHFPKAFYCPITQKIMLDPVVHPNGLSYERSAIVEQEPSALVYPNRALNAYMDQVMERFADVGSVRGTIQKWNESLRTGWQKLLEKSALPSDEYRPLPDAFYCPISFDLIHVPVIDPDGHTYERQAIVQWINANGDSPITRNPMTVDQLYDNNSLLEIMLELTETSVEEEIHPSIRRWKQELSSRQAQAATATAPLEAEVSPTNEATSNTATGNRTYPTSRDELEAERRQRIQRQRQCTAFGLILAGFIVVIFFPSYFFLVWFLFVISMVVSCEARSETTERQRNERRQRQQQQGRRVQVQT